MVCILLFYGNLKIGTYSHPCRICWECFEYEPYEPYEFEYFLQMHDNACAYLTKTVNQSAGHINTGNTRTQFSSSIAELRIPVGEECVPPEII